MFALTHAHTIQASSFALEGNHDEAKVATNIESAGLVLLGTELRSVKFYWHVDKHSAVRIFPSEYSATAVGILWQTMAQLQTWFGSNQYLAYGIQLLPFTPVSEFRDSIRWLRTIYLPFTTSCSSDPNCIPNGWSILGLGVLATIGHQNLAYEGALAIPDDAFESAGGNGHSRSNLLWFVSTRKQVPFPMPLHDNPVHSVNTSLPRDFELVDCFQPLSCTEYALDTVVDKYTCRQRIEWIMNAFRKTQKDACFQVASLEYPKVCGACDPYKVFGELKETSDQPSISCPRCTEKQCQTDLNRCPDFERTYVCSSGKNRGGCRGTAWPLHSGECDECCELTACSGMEENTNVTFLPADDSDCPTCPAMLDLKRLCPQDSSAPYLCYEGQNRGGCSPRPWDIVPSVCSKCCKIS